jgi:hypothetical protein
MGGLCKPPPDFEISAGPAVAYIIHAPSRTKMSLYVDVTTSSGAEISLNDGVITPTNTVKERTADEEHIYY